MGAALIRTECINETKNKRKPLFVATLDVQKAFDVVNHELLLRKLYLDGITGNDWLLVRDIYKDMTPSVKRRVNCHHHSSLVKGYDREASYQRPITRGIITCC